MPPNSPKTLSPAELAKLEHAFATDPASEAYHPLAEAYLGMGRFMEAMVVCKKGVKAHPQKPDPRVLLARVYAEQGKDKKALEELASAQGVAPNDKTVLRMTGALQLKGGEADAGRTNLLKALQLDPGDAETKALFVQYKVQLPQAAPPPPPAQPPPQLQPVGQGNGLPSVVVSQQGGNGAPQQVVQRQAPQQGRGPPQQARAAPRQQPRPPPRSESSDYHEIPSELSETGHRRRRRSHGAAVTIALAVLVVVGLSAYWAIGQYRAKQLREVRRLLGVAADALKNDSYDSYQKAAKAAGQALDVDPNSAQAHAYAAYANVIRWGEHGGDENVRQQAEEHIGEARKNLGKETAFTHLIAAEALLPYYQNKGAQALKELKGQLAEFEEKGQRPSLLLLTAGLIEMNQGDLDASKEHLEKAQSYASDDPRIYSALGTLSRRRGNDADALRHFNTALKYTRNSHPEALSGTALLILDQDSPGLGYITAAKYLKTLLESEPPPSPRQLAMAHMVRALLVSRVSRDVGTYVSKEVVKTIEDGTGVTADPAKAKSEIQKEEDLGMQDKANPELYLVKGKRFLYEENYNAAASEIRKALEMNGQRAHYHVELARVLMRKEGGEKDAENALRDAIKLVGETPKLMTLLGQALYKQKKIDEALATYEKAVKDPKAKNAEARFALGRIWRDDKKDCGKAAEYFEKAAQEFYGDTMMVAASYDDLGVSWECKGDKAKARKAYEDSLNADKEFDKAYCDLARFLSKADKLTEKDKDLMKASAVQYLKMAPRGECAEDMRRLEK